MPKKTENGNGMDVLENTALPKDRGERAKYLDEAVKVGQLGLGKALKIIQEEELYKDLDFFIFNWYL